MTERGGTVVLRDGIFDPMIFYLFFFPVNLTHFDESTISNLINLK